MEKIEKTLLIVALIAIAILVIGRFIPAAKEPKLNKWTLKKKKTSPEPEPEESEIDESVQESNDPEN